MTAVLKLPDIKPVRELIEGLIGREVEVEVIDGWAPEPADPVAVGMLVNDLWRPQVFALLDLPAAVFLGAALGLTPPGGAEDMVAERAPSAGVLENLYEVINVLTSVFNDQPDVHLRLAEFFAPGAGLNPEVAGVLSRLGGRLDLGLDVRGYGRGRFSLIVV